MGDNSGSICLVCRTPSCYKHCGNKSLTCGIVGGSQVYICLESCEWRGLQTSWKKNLNEHFKKKRQYGNIWCQQDVNSANYSFSCWFCHILWDSVYRQTVSGRLTIGFWIISLPYVTIHGRSNAERNQICFIQRFYHRKPGST